MTSVNKTATLHQPSQQVQAASTHPKIHCSIDTSPLPLESLPRKRGTFSNHSFCIYNVIFLKDVESSPLSIRLSLNLND